MPDRDEQLPCQTGQSQAGLDIQDDELGDDPSMRDRKPSYSSPLGPVSKRLETPVEFHNNIINIYIYFSMDYAMRCLGTCVTYNYA